MLTSFQFYILGWLYASDYEIQHDRLSTILYSDTEYDHFDRLVYGNNNFILERYAPSLLTVLITKEKMSLTLYIFDHAIIDNANKYYDNVYFKRGYFDACGSIELDNYITCSIPVSEKSNKLFNLDFQKHAAKIDGNEWVWEETNALNFICELYNVICQGEPADEFYMESNLCKIDSAKQIFLEETPKFIYSKVKPDAVAPTKEFATYPGFSIHVCEKLREEDGIHYYTTGLRFSCEYGYYLEIYGEKLYKLGYMLANPFDVIKPGDSEELVLPLIKLSPHVEELVLPCHVANVIPKKLNLVEFHEINL
jgi:hypothetical protein